MATRSLFSTLRRHKIYLSNSSLHSAHSHLFQITDDDRRKCTPNLLLIERRIGASRMFSSSVLENDQIEDSVKEDDLKSRIFRLRFPKRSATAALQKWVAEGHKVTISELRDIAKELRKSQRYKHALEILTWMEAQNSSRMSATDHAAIVELIIKVRSLQEAEGYFENILDSTTQKAAFLPLLHAYVKERETEKAEVLMLKLQGLGLIVDAHPFNEMMKLYMATGQLKKVPLMIQQMKQNMIMLNVLSYNLWLRACGELSGAASAEMVYEEMLTDKKIEVGWSTHATLANIFTRTGYVDKAIEVLKTAELTLSTCKHLGYFFLMTLYANLNNKDGVHRLWEASKRVGGRITCSNYMCVLSCFVKIGDFGEAERVFRSWEDACGRYDIRVSNILLGAYVRNGWIDKAESLHLHTLEKGGCPNYKTWEILMEGWIKSKEMDKAISAMKKGFSMLKHCHWRPPSEIVLAIAEYFEESEQFEDAKKYMKVLHRLGLASLPLYKSVLKVHIRARKPALDILKIMERDEVHLDEEASALIKCLNQISISEE